MADSTHLERVKRIQAIEKARGSVVVSVVTSDRHNLQTHLRPVFVRHVFDLARESLAANKDAKRLDIFIYSRGGESDVPWALMSMLREIAPNLEIGTLIPYRAHSAATIAALGADSVVMGPKGELGPIDTTMVGFYNPQHPKTKDPMPVSVEDVLGYFSLLDRIGCAGPDSKIEGLKELARNVHPYALGMVQRLEDQTKLVASQLLNSRKKPFTEAENSAIVDAVAKRINSHNHAISRTEATQHVGLRSVTFAEKEKIDEELWSLYLLYEQKFLMEQPFVPEEDFFADNNLEEKKYEDLPLACVESTKRCRTLVTTINMTRRRDAVQTLTLSPQITIPALSIAPGMDAAAVQAAVQSALQRAVQQAVQDAIKELNKSAPTKGFERRESNTIWQENSVPSST